jgi:hypothetical protein
MDISHKQQDNITPVSTFETVDLAVFTWLNEMLDIQATTNDGIRKVPVIWFSQERAFQIKEGKDNRDENGLLDFPLIQLARTSTDLTPVIKRPIPGIINGGSDYKNSQFGFWTKVSQKKTSNFANANSQRMYGQQTSKFKNQNVVTEHIFVPYPSYYDMKYEITLKALYMQQINEMMAPVQRAVTPYNSQVFEVRYGGFKYEAFMPKETGFTTNSSQTGEEEKVYEAKFLLEVLGFTTTAQLGQTTPTIVRRDGPTKVRIQRERVILGDINYYGDEDTPFRE